MNAVPPAHGSGRLPAYRAVYMQRYHPFPTCERFNVYRSYYDEYIGERVYYFSAISLLRAAKVGKAYGGNVRG